MSGAWAVWLVIILFLVAIIGIIVWIAINNNIPGDIHRDHVKISKIKSSNIIMNTEIS